MKAGTVCLKEKKKIGGVACKGYVFGLVEQWSQVSTNIISRGCFVMSALVHSKSLTNTVKCTALVVQFLSGCFALAVFSRAESSKVFRGNGHGIFEQFHDNFSSRFAINGNVKKDAGILGVGNIFQWHLLETRLSTIKTCKSC